MTENQFCMDCGGEYTDELPCVCEPKTIKRLHMVIHRNYMITQLQSAGANWRALLVDISKDLSLGDAIKSFEDGKEWIPIGDCDNRDPKTGECLGHEA